MPAIIRLLDDLTINKIAAGEVVENPASVVKELVENSLDAGASEITVEIGAGGRHLIRITDNGIGMGRDDALLSLERHATSKIRHIDDLSALSSLGFRGEAVPSISAISRFSILTSDGVESTLVKVDGGKLTTCEKAERSKGTTMEVKDLFFNLPVRKKFLKSPALDETAIVRRFSELAIARPDVKFKLIVNQKPVLNLPIQEPEARIAATLGSPFKEDLLPLGGVSIRGYVGLPHKGRPNRSSQYLFLNGRSIKSSFVSWAVKEGYSTHLPDRRFPMFVLWLNLPSHEVDVNVHPQKLEVRFRDERGLQEIIVKAVRDALYTKRVEAPLSSLNMAMPPKWEVPNLVKETIEEPLVLDIPSLKPTPGRVVATLKGYLIAEVPGEEGVQLIDQERAHARVTYEKLLKTADAALEQEALLIPYTLALSKPDGALLKENLEALNTLGFEIREFGVDTFLIDAYPSAYKKVELETVILSFLEDIKGCRQSRPLNERLAERSASFAFKEKRILSLAEGQRLIEDLAQCEEPGISPSGKPVRVQLDAKTLAKHF